VCAIRRAAALAALLMSARYWATQVIYFRVSLRRAAIMTDEIKFRLTAVKSQRSAAKMNHFRRPAHRLSFFYFAGCLLAWLADGKSCSNPAAAASTLIFLSSHLSHLIQRRRVTKKIQL
jgi:hypothetical protein